ncbi:CaiB/BaiF CoA-transferase family protein [Actinomadura sp. DC4]|uniref:CaiB/BaiF CoA transferase family protein n=1 Tax=Actinomadura sp. DC4 TaxID=3055069 RepID=UPI0025B12420|nr:CaiB/BaiF CoA-transferase family protein [Actinomadura sp. DC4]MDN3351843.1 CaiB/BaiF CoA-transferase family protein [Actinomadura sp. DC4]
MGPLHGVRVIEIASLAPAPFGCMVLSDLGADVLRVDRPTSVGRDASPDPLGRGRRSIGLNLKDPAGVDVLLRLVETADVLVEGFRPGVTERLGFGPDVCLERNPGLVYGRMTGWGQEGPMSQMAGHDINYIAIAGALEPIGRAGERPVPPLNLLGDFGGGGMLLAVGILSALFERSRSGRGQVVDAAMVDGAALLTSFIHGMRGSGAWQDARGTNLLDTGAPFYDTYETADGLFMSVGALEPQFYAALLHGLGLADEDLPGQLDRDRWPELRARFTEVFKQRTRDEWTAVFDGTDACVAPILGLAEAPAHGHATARTGFIEVGGLPQPAPAPRFSRTSAETPAPPVRPGEHTDAALGELGLTPEEIADLRESGAIA